MKPEDYSACESAIFYYENPWFAVTNVAVTILKETNNILSKTMEYEYSTVCKDCGYSETHTVDEGFDIVQWVEENWVHHMPHDY